MTLLEETEKRTEKTRIRDSRTFLSDERVHIPTRCPESTGAPVRMLLVAEIP